MSPETLIAENQLLKEKAKSLHEEIEILKERIKWFERQVFGQKRERFIPTDEQLLLDLGIKAITVPPVTEHVEYDRSKPSPNASAHYRGELPEHLRRERIEIRPDFDTTGMKQISEKITEELRMKPAEFYVAQLVRPVWVAQVDGESTIHCPLLPARCIDKGIAGASVIAQTIITKCVDHNPLYRFRNQIERNCNLNIPLTTLDGWFAKGIFWLQSIANRLHEIVRAHDYIQMDETTIKVMIEPTNGKSHLSYMWLMHAPELKIVTFDYCTTRNKKILDALIGPNYKGFIQTDGLELYEILDFRDGVIHVGCAQHARRCFFEAKDNDLGRAQVALDIWQQLFAIEADAKKENLAPEQRLELRQKKSVPIIEVYKAWLNTSIKEVTPKSLIGKAIAYSLNRWEQLTRFLENGRIEISDNSIENRVRPFALGRKNWLFSGSENGAARLAAAYTVMGTGLLCGVNLFEYVSDVLEKIPSRKANDIDDLLPINWKSAKKAEPIVIAE